MATLSIPNNFINGTVAVATEVNANFTAVKTFVEGISAGTNIDDGNYLQQVGCECRFSVGCW